MSKLENGLIPAGKPCPFLKECGMVFERCPTEDKPKDRPFSCAAARGLDMCDKHNLPQGSLLPTVLRKKFST